MTGTVWGVQNLVVENGEIESEPEADRVRRCQLSLGDIGSVLCTNQLSRIIDKVGKSHHLVGLMSGSGCSLALLT